MALMRYTALRVALFLGVAALLFAFGVRNLFVCALLAILISGVVSVVALKRVRSEVSVGRAPAERGPKQPRQSPLARINQRIDAAARAEDEADDAERASINDDMPPIPRPDLPGWEHHLPETTER